jgi:2-polyprenyl-3-methyl-5-hydroxy-6-metoxy-1,4-benzoquinol methylase
MISRTGKSLQDVLWFQEDFVRNEEDLLHRQQMVESEYIKGPIRLMCVICASSLDLSDKWYARGAIRYIFCATCGHVNGSRLETESFLTYAYTDEQTTNSRKPYDSEFNSGNMYKEFDQTVKRIYLPKASFLKDVLESQGLDVSKIKLIDFGCGAGHFISALEQVGFRDVIGVETLQSALDLCVRNGISSEKLKLIHPSQTYSYLREADCHVLTMMCVLPHLSEPLQAINALKENAKCVATFQKLPKWSYATSIETVFPENRSRVLSSDHTSVFSLESIAWLEKKIGLSVWGEWNFGGDYLDLFRKLVAKSYTVEMTEELRESLREQWMQFADEMQLVLDTCRQSSEVHIVWGTN